MNKINWKVMKPAILAVLCISLMVTSIVTSSCRNKKKTESEMTMDSNRNFLDSLAEVDTIPTDTLYVIE